MKKKALFHQKGVDYVGKIEKINMKGGNSNGCKEKN
jgi:hypothetical protein